LRKRKRNSPVRKTVIAVSIVYNLKGFDVKKDNKWVIKYDLENAAV
jgi:hypothetical protein